jgi:hypothetical protein
VSDDFLSRWSRLKRASAQASAADAKAPPQPAKGEESAARPPAPAGEVPAQPPAPLPPVESLGFDSDFTAFMKPEVGEALKRQALKTLFQDPRFNVMDGLDVYIDDYSKPDPLPEGWLEKMNQVVRLGDYQPPVEEVPREPGAQPSPAPPEPGEEAAKGPQNEALATSARPPSSDTPEAQPMPLQVTESRPSE